MFTDTRISYEKAKQSDETLYYITTLDATPQKLMEIARSHWKIESMHWMLDVVFAEDDCLLRDEEAQLAMNSFRKLALALHKNYLKNKCKKGGLSNNMLQCLSDDSLLCDLIKNL